LEYRGEVLDFLEKKHGYCYDSKKSNKIILGSVSKKDMQVSSDNKDLLENFLKEITENVLKKIVSYGNIKKIEAVATWF
jgi:hypothetical protein